MRLFTIFPSSFASIDRKCEPTGMCQTHQTSIWKIESLYGEFKMNNMYMFKMSRNDIIWTRKWSNHADHAFGQTVGAYRFVWWIARESEHIWKAVSRIKMQLNAWHGRTNMPLLYKFRILTGWFWDIYYYFHVSMKDMLLKTSIGASDVTYCLNWQACLCKLPSVSGSMPHYLEYYPKMSSYILPHHHVFREMRPSVLYIFLWLVCMRLLQIAYDVHEKLVLWDIEYEGIN